MYLLLVNPEAGNKRFRKIEPAMIRLLDSLGVKYKIVILEDLENAEGVIEKYLTDKIKGVVAVGGNATVNTVINGLGSEDVPVGIIPMSKTNNLAKSLAIRSWSEGIKILADPEIRPARLGKIDKHYFVDHVDVSSQINLISKYLPKTNFLHRFLGLSQNITVNDLGVKSSISIDEELKVTGRVQRVHIQLNDAREAERMSVEIYTRGNKGPEKTVLPGSVVYIDSARRMPVLLGNETVAHTPVEIRGLNKYIQLMAKKSAKLTN